MHGPFLVLVLVFITQLYTLLLYGPELEWLREYELMKTPEHRPHSRFRRPLATK